MNARTPILLAALLATTASLALAAPASASSSSAQAAEAVRAMRASDVPAAQSAGLLTGLNDLLAGTVGALLDTTGQLVASVDPTQGVLTGVTGQLVGTLDMATGALFDTTGQLLAVVDGLTGLVLDPLGNIIGALIPTGQTSSTGGGGPGSPSTPTGQSPSFTLPISLALSSPRVQKLGTVAKRGLRATARCSITCGVLAAITVDGRTAKRLGLGRGLNPVTIGTAGTGRAGTFQIRITSRARKALSRGLPTSKTRKRVKSQKVKAQRQLRAARTAKAKRSARRKLSRLRKQESRFLRGQVKFTVAALAYDSRGRTSSTRRQSLIVKR